MYNHDVKNNVNDELNLLEFKLIRSREFKIYMKVRL